MKKAIIGLIICLFFGGIGWKVYVVVNEKKEKKKRAPNIVPVVFGAVKTGNVEDVRSFTGTLEAETEFDLMPKIGGLIKRVHVDIGDTVTNGQLIAEIADDELQMALRQERAQMQVVDARLSEADLVLESAKKEYDRSAALREGKVISAAALEQEKIVLAKAKIRASIAASAKEQAQMSLEAAELRASYAKLHVRWQGDDKERVVAARYLDDGARVVSSKPVVRIVGIKQLRAVIHVAEKDYPKIHAGQTATIKTDAHPELTFEGKVVRVSPVISKSSRQAQILLKVANDKGLLRPGMFAKVELVFSRKKDAVLIPESALCSRKNVAGIYRADKTGERAAFVPVKVGIQADGMAEILSPKLSGRIVVVGQHLLRPGARIEESKAYAAKKQTVKKTLVAKKTEAKSIPKAKPTDKPTDKQPAAKGSSN
jgi:RND family efflux transporter MFP subunit